MLASLQQWATERGYRVACGDLRLLDATRSELEQRRTAGELDASFDRKRLGFFRYENSAEEMAHPRAVIMVAVPRPAHRLTFESETGAFDTILPPTYVRYSELYEDVRNEIGSRIPGLAGRLHILLAPLKPVACRMGLVTYGRNNITYIAGWGSYFQLLGYLTDAHLGLDEQWVPQPLQLMPECDTCGICASACPTGAISDERVLLHAERCTTYFSEEPGNLADGAACLSGRCLFGCLECQEICPVNHGLLQTVPSGVSFDRSETDAILAAGPDEGSALPAAITHKLAVLGLTEQSLIARNLRYLIAHQTP